MGHTVPLQALHEALRAAWSADTSASPAWSPANCAKGQCAVTACVVQDYLGGDILHANAALPTGETVSHYFNIIDDETVDYTQEQFPDGTIFSEPAPKTNGFPSTRVYCLSYDATRERYDLLSSRVAAYLRSRKE
ncbi:YunG family protein [Nocardia wallacei]|uniref:YunG family protein n=1 Tax=Nocardia wallacei TaxID=480035 RepID=UPI002454799B|nr:hypothetical protein [Nocardia wallacei]